MDKIKETASESTLKASGVNAQPINRTEQKKLTPDERRERFFSKLERRTVCRQCRKEMPELETPSLVLEEAEQILAEHKCQPIILLDEFEKANKLTKIQGILTSNLRSRTSSDTPYMAFLRLETADFKNHSLEECQEQKCKDCEIPVVFRIDAECQEIKIKCDCAMHLWRKPDLKKGQKAILEGQWANSKDSNRPSFTCYSYQIINSHGK